eukprot:scaffold225506_cov30-Tisochrysis_lutea.AAC.1
MARAAAENEAALAAEAELGSVLQNAERLLASERAEDEQVRCSPPTHALPRQKCPTCGQGHMRG